MPYRERSEFLKTTRQSNLTYYSKEKIFLRFKEADDNQDALETLHRYYAEFNKKLEDLKSIQRILPKTSSQIDGSWSQ